MKQPKQTIIDALHQYMEDNFNRAKLAFKSLSDNELDSEYEESGKTYRQILNEYKQHRNEVKNALFWVNTL